MTQITRRYIYEDTLKEVMVWYYTNREKIARPPNNKENFHFYLQEYLNHLKFKAGLMEERKND